ncbi:hypothetical protein U14_01795 [Candidatus Moduliflexus flocculans]|uniref:Sulfotransferase family protein n=1 Tax=Candidatus Moduliflexus flocculans TaxID=1499966 RepID=A0A0S6VYK3_9BACT|nr:hypothetical protein U14_01795 [Candidatus Moduliflexus flocculans]
MNVFILCTGRCGSMTFIEACKQITNYSCGHESREHLLGADRLNYPKNHIEADNRLSWLLGRLEAAYGDHAFYVHLKRDDTDTACSYTKRYERGIIRAYREDILFGSSPDYDPMAVCLDFCQTINANIAAFLKDKTQTMPFSFEYAKRDFAEFWNRIGAKGDLERALAAWDITYNASKPEQRVFPSRSDAPFFLKFRRKMKRMLHEFPTFIRNV